MADCPKCRGRMTQGFLYAPDSGSRIRWVDGEPSWKAMFGLGTKATDLTAQRCASCGFVEFFADASAKPVETMATLVDENEHLRRLVSRLNERLATLEEIVTDPGERTARAIEALRAPPPRDDPER